MNTIILTIILLVKKPFDSDYSALPERIEANPKSPKFNLDDWVRMTMYKNIFSKDYLKKYL